MTTLYRFGRVFLGSIAALLVAAPVAQAAPRNASSATGSTFRTTHRCGTRQVPGPLLSPPRNAHAAGDVRTIYLNRNGGTYQIGSGATNSSTNHASSSVLGTGSRTAVIPPLDTGDFDWAYISACVRAAYEPYDIRIVETEPTSGDYIEAVVGGDGSEIGFGGGSLFGIASADNFCGVTERGIAFSFSETHRGVGQDDEELCATIAHEIGHLVALEHEVLDIDLMSYVLVVDSTGDKSFVDRAVSCGTEPRDAGRCSCTTTGLSGSQTNSALRLSTYIGERPTETVPPTLALLSPSDDARVSPYFTVAATASDDQAMEGVSVLLNGLEVAADFEPDGDRYEIAVSNVAEGEYTLAVQAQDRAGNVATDEIAITVAKLATGSDCATPGECEGGVCAGTSDGNFCTQACDLAGDSCPADFTCTEASSGPALCAPDDSGGCCSTTGKPPASTLALIGGVGLLLMRRRRRAAR